MYLLLLRLGTQPFHQSPFHPAFAQLLYLDAQAQGLHQGAASIPWNHGHLGEHQTAQGIVVPLLVLGKLDRKSVV